MNLLVVCYEHPPVGGGGGRVAADVARELAARGHRVTFLTGNARGGGGPFPADTTSGGVRVIRVNTPRKLPEACTVPEMVFYLLWSLLPGLRVAREVRPDAMHVHFAVPSGALALPISVFTGTPYVLTAHLGDVPGGVPEQTGHLFRFLKPFTVPIWRRAAKVTAVSRFVAGLAKAAYGVEPEVVHNGLAFRPARAPSPAGRPLRLLFAGRISVQKNLMLALRALELLREEDWVLDVVGDGPLRGEAEAFSRTAGIAAKVRFHGWLGAEALRELRERAAVLLMPSRQEGLPMAAVEALAAGLAIVGSAIPGLADVAEDGRNAILCEQEPGAFAGAISRLLREPGTLEGFRRRSIEKAADFALPKIIDRYETLLDAVCNRNGLRDFK